jgi:mono/diheme cytochrome c family protein
MVRLFVTVVLTLTGMLSVVSIARGQGTPVPGIIVTAVPAPDNTPDTPVPTIDRLAAPPTVPSPTQADEGAQLYWLHCQPCHGDQGQGLTDEWRMQYPEEDRNCWNSGCHGRNPYEGGFTVPTVVPAVIGDGSLARFETIGDLYEYMRVAMPLSFPGTLTEEEYLAITAYLARAHGVWDGRRLNAARAHELRLQPPGTAAVEPSDELVNQTGGLTPTPELVVTAVTLTAAAEHTPELNWPLALIIILLIVGGIGGIGLWSRYR